MIPTSKNKWLKYRFLKTSRTLAHRLPETRLFSQHSFWKLLSKYKRIVIKPVGGSRGRGVFLVSSIGSHKYSIHYENRKTTMAGRESTYRYLKRKMGSPTYMVQRCVSRAKIGGRPFDMRVIIQRRKYSRSWKVTGKVVKVTGKGYFVSNITRSGGKVMKVRSALRKSSIKHLSKTKIEAKIDRTALKSARKLNHFFKGHRIYGLDMGVDRKGRVWIIEANLFPARSHFRLLKDKTMLRRITSYKRG